MTKQRWLWTVLVPTAVAASVFTVNAGAAWWLSPVVFSCGMIAGAWAPR